MMKLRIPPLTNVLLLVLIKMIIVACNNNIDDGISPYGELNSKAPKETLQFGQLVGKWDVISYDSIPNEGWHESKATWTFRYSLDGFAIEDIWFEKFEDETNNTKNIGRNFMGKNIRIFDPQADQWNIVWIENGSNTLLATITAKENDSGEIVMKPPGSSSEITFYKIDADNFDWKFEILNGSSRILYTKMSAKRIE